MPPWGGTTLPGRAGWHDDLAQIARHRLPQRQQPDCQTVEVALELVDLKVTFNDLSRKLAVALHDRFDGGG